MTWPRDGHIIRKKTVEIQLPWTTLAAASKQAKFVPASAWSLVADYTQVRGWGELAGTTGDIEVVPAVQLASDPRKPGRIVRTSTAFKKEGVFDVGDALKLAPSHGDHDKVTYIRVGWLVSSPTGELVHGTAGGMIELSADED